MMKIGRLTMNTRIMWKVLDDSEPGVRSVTVIGKECPAVFSQAVGTLSLNDLDILSARSYRQGANTLAMFKVRSLPGRLNEAERLRRAERDLQASLAKRLNLTEAFRKKMSMFCKNPVHSLIQEPCDVNLDNKTSFLYSIIEVSANDFPGVLFTMSDAIMKCNLVIWNAKILTKGTHVSDTFYVKDEKGQKLRPAQVPFVRARLKNALNICNPS